MTHDDGLDSVDSVHADNLGACDDAKLTAVGIRDSKQNPPKTSRYSRVGRTQDDENTLAAPKSADSGRARGAGGAGYDEIDGPDHFVRLAGAGSLRATGPLSVRKNASSWRNSTGFSRNARNSLWPVAAAGARL